MRTAPARIEFEVERKQALFLNSQADELVYSGGFGGGKTLMVCLLAFLRAQHPRAVEVLARARESDVRDTILPTLFEGSGRTPAILQPGTYLWNKQEKWIRLLGPRNMPLGLLRYRGLGANQQQNLDKMGFRGQNVTGVGIDQMEEISFKQYNNVLGRVRVADDGLTRMVYGSVNPSAPSHWIAKRFGITSGHDPTSTETIKSEIVVGDRVNHLEAILTCPGENPHLPADYRARLATFTGVERLRYVEGRWVASEGVVYDNFTRGRHVKARNTHWARVLVGVDDGTSKPAALLLVQIDGDGRRHYAREVHRAGMSNAEKVQAVLNWQREFGVLDGVVVDPAASGLKLDLIRAGLPVFNGKNEVLPGISIVRQALEAGPSGEPGLTIDPTCTNTIGEMEGYMWDPNSPKDKVIKRDDHGPDAIRYVECHVYDPPALVFDMGGMAGCEAAAERAEPECRVSILHTHAAGREQDISIAQRKVDAFRLAPSKDGPITMWTMPHRKPGHRHVIFASVSDGQGASPSILTVADSDRRVVVAQWNNATNPERLARVAAMLSMWFGDENSPAPVGCYGNTPGMVFSSAMGSMGFPCDVWTPSTREFGEAVGLLRAAWSGKRLIETDPSVFAVARQYVYAGQAVMHASLVEDVERRGSYADAVIARAGLWRMLVGVGVSEPQRPDPGVNTVESRRRQREAERQAAKRIKFG